MHRALVGAFFTLSLAACGPDLQAGEDELDTTSSALTTVTGFGSNPGGLKMYATIPTTPAASAGLVVAMHGCTQSAAEYQKAGWDTFAQRYGFYVLYPEITSGSKCFGWFDSTQTTRGRGQALSIAQGVAYMQSRYAIDASKIFITGLSAGGGMTNSMLAAYPDLFAAGASMAGLPAGCANSIGQASGCQQGPEKTPAQWAALVRASAPAGNTRWPRVAVWNGDADYTVNVKNLNEIMEQWTQAYGVDQTVDATSTVGRATRREYRDANGRTIVETFTVGSMGHGTAVAPSAGCGQTGAFILDVGLCSTEWSVKFFGLDQNGTVDAGTPPVIDAGTPPVVDAGTPPVVDAGMPPVVDAGSGGTCVAFEDTNYNQVTAGRALRCGTGNSYVCAKGSGEQLGLWNTFYRSTVKSTDGVYWSKGACP